MTARILALGFAAAILEDGKPQSITSFPEVKIFEVRVTELSVDAEAGREAFT